MALGATLIPRPPPARTPDTRGSFKPSLLPLEDIQVIPPLLSPPFSRISYFLAIQLFASQSVTIYCWDYCKDVANDESPHAPLGLGPASFPAPTPPNHPPPFFRSSIRGLGAGDCGEFGRHQIESKRRPWKVPGL